MFIYECSIIIGYRFYAGFSINKSLEDPTGVWGLLVISLKFTSYCPNNYIFYIFEQYVIKQILLMFALMLKIMQTL